MSKPSTSPESGQPGLRTCASCSREVERKDCHRNRYGEYICRSCMAQGTKFGARGRLLHAKSRAKTALTWAGWLLFFGVVALSYYSVTREYALEVLDPDAQP